MTGRGGGKVRGGRREREERLVGEAVHSEISGRGREDEEQRPDIDRNIDGRDLLVEETIEDSSNSSGRQSSSRSRLERWSVVVLLIDFALRGRLAAGGKGDPAGSAYYEGSWIESVVILVE